MSDWKKTKIGDFLFERKGKYKPNDKLIAGLQRIEKIDFSGNFHIASKPSKTNMILIKKGDLVISGINVAKGAMGIYSEEDDVVATIHYSSYTFDETKINVGYFKRFLKSAEFIRLIEEQIKGGIKTEIKPKHILPLEILLPSLEEQELIVKHFESVETEDLSLNNEISNQQNLLKKLRQQILQDAIEGRLTKDWREQNPDVEPASELLTRIQAEKEQLIKDKKIKKQKALPAITDDEKPFELPESWTWCRLGEIITDTDSGWSPKCDEFPAKKGAWGVLKTTAVQRMEFVPSKNKSLPNGLSERPNIEVKKGDILITRAGPTNRVGICALVRKTPSRLMLSDKIIRFHPIEVYGEFIELFVGSGLFQELIKNFKTGMAESQVNISQLNLKRVLIPLLPISEQKSIVKKVEKLFAICDQLEEQITSSQTNAEQLMQSVLKEAFSQDEKVA